jgi:hypothetical protein
MDRLLADGIVQPQTRATLADSALGVLTSPDAAVDRLRAPVGNPKH